MKKTNFKLFSLFCAMFLCTMMTCVAVYSAVNQTGTFKFAGSGTGTTINFEGTNASDNVAATLTLSVHSGATDATKNVTKSITFNASESSQLKTEEVSSITIDNNGVLRLYIKVKNNNETKALDVSLTNPTNLTNCTITVEQNVTSVAAKGEQSFLIAIKVTDMTKDASIDGPFSVALTVHNEA